VHEELRSRGAAGRRRRRNANGSAATRGGRRATAARCRALPPSAFPLYDSILSSRQLPVICYTTMCICIKLAPYFSISYPLPSKPCERRADRRFGISRACPHHCLPLRPLTACLRLLAFTCFSSLDILYLRARMLRLPPPYLLSPGGRGEQASLPPVPARNYQRSRGGWRGGIPAAGRWRRAYDGRAWKVGRRRGRHILISSLAFVRAAATASLPRGRLSASRYSSRQRRAWIWDRGACQQRLRAGPACGPGAELSAGPCVACRGGILTLAGSVVRKYPPR